MVVGLNLPLSAMHKVYLQFQFTNKKFTTPSLAQKYQGGHNWQVLILLKATFVQAKLPNSQHAIYEEIKTFY